MVKGRYVLHECAAEEVTDDWHQGLESTEPDTCNCHVLDFSFFLRTAPYRLKPQMHPLIILLLIIVIQ